VSKPVKPEKLQAAIDRFTGLKAVERETRETGAVGAIDLKIIAGFREMDIEGEESILAKLIDVFLENTPRVLLEARAAVAKRMSPQLERAAHTLKGSCSNFGAERMRKACETLEAVARGGELERAEELINLIEKEFEYVRLALEHERPACAVA